MKALRIIFASAFILCLSAAAFGQYKPAENFTGEALDGRYIELELMRGKVVVMTFWSTKCAICDAEIPKLNQMVKKYEGKEVVFLGLTIDNPTKVESFLKEKYFAFDIVPNSFGTLVKYADKDSAGNINMGFPSYFVVDQKGDIELKDSGWDKTQKVDAKITKLLEGQN